MPATTIVLLGAFLYLAAIVWVGVVASRNVADSADFIVAGRRLPLSLCTFTLFATWFGAGTCLGAAGAAYEGGFLAVIADPFGAGLCLLIAGLFYVRILRRMSLLTVPDLFRVRFGPTAELLSAILVFPAYIGWVASQFVGFGFILHTLTGIDTLLAILIGAAVVLAYTTAGGMWAVTLTDFVQALILILGLLVLFPLVLSDVGGWSGLVARAPEGTFAMVPAGGLIEWIWYLEAWLVIGIGNLPGQDLIQRALSARNESVAQWSSYLAALLYFTVGLVPVLLGIAGRLLIPEIADPEFILPQLGIRYLHPVAMAVFVGALFSALMSSADSALLAPASIFGRNILRRLRKDVTEGQMLRGIRWAVVGSGLLALGTGLYFQRVYDLMVNSWQVLMVSLLVPMTAGLYWRKANAPAAVASILVGTLAWIALALVQSALPADLLATGLALLTLVGVTLATSRSRPPRPLVDLEGAVVEYRERLGTLGIGAPR